MTKAQERRIERLRSDTVMALYLQYAEQGKLEGDVIHCGGTISLNVKGLGRVKVQVSAALEGPPRPMVIRRVE